MISPGGSSVYQSSGSLCSPQGRSCYEGRRTTDAPTAGGQDGHQWLARRGDETAEPVDVASTAQHWGRGRCAATVPFRTACSRHRVERSAGSGRTARACGPSGGVPSGGRIGAAMALSLESGLLVAQLVSGEVRRLTRAASLLRPEWSGRPSRSRQHLRAFGQRPFGLAFVRGATRGMFAGGLRACGNCVLGPVCPFGFG